METLSMIKLLYTLMASKSERSHVPKNLDRYRVKIYLDCETRPVGKQTNRFGF